MLKSTKINNAKYVIPFLIFWFIIIALGLVILGQFPFGISNDGARYLFGADNLLKGNGFYEYTKYHDDLQAITAYPPVYSGLTALLAFLFNIPVLLAAQVLNYSSWVAFFGVWFAISYYFFEKTIFFHISCLALLISNGIWGYVNTVGSEIIFALFIALIFLSYIFFRIKKQTLRYLILIGIFSGALILTRFAGIAFVGVIFIVLLFDDRYNFRKKIINCLIYGSITFLPVALWLFRNYQLSGKAASRLVGKNSFTINKIDEAINILYYFLSDVFFVPSSIEKFSFIVLAGLVFIFIFYRKNRLKSSKRYANFWLILSLALYFGMVLISGLKSGHNRVSGFMRYFYMLHPIAIMLLILYLKNICEYKAKLPLYKGVKLGSILFIAIILLLGANRLRVYGQSLSHENNFEKLKQSTQHFLQKDDLFLSNQNNILAIYYNRPCFYVEAPSRIKKLLLEWWQKPYNDVYMALSKSIGVNYRQGVPTYDEIINALPCEILYEDSKYIFVKIDKNSLKNE